MLIKFKTLINKIDIVSAKFKTTIMVLMCLIISIVFTIALSKFNTTDTIPELKAINSKIIQELGPLAVNVKTGMYIKNFPTFDVIKNDITFDAILWFEFNSDEISLDNIQKFSFDQDKILYKSPPDIKISGNQIFAKFQIIINIKTSLNYHKFPFEDHKIAIMMTNNFFTPSEMYFTTDSNSFQLAPNIIPTSWKPKDLNVNAGYQELDLSKEDKTKKVFVPKALFTIDIEKQGIRKILIIFIPLFASVFLGFFSFAMNIANIVGKFSLSISAVTALLGYRFVIEQMMPQVGYLTLTDILYLLLLLIALMCFIFQLLITRLYLLYSEDAKKTADKGLTQKFNYLEKINGITFLIISFILTVLTSVIIMM